MQQGVARCGPRRAPLNAFEQARALFLGALERHQRGQLADAESLYRQAHALMPERVSVLANLATVLVELQRPGEALAFCERALALEPGHPEALATHAACTRALHGAAPALQEVENALAADPGNPALLAHHAALLAQAGGDDDALAAYGRALAQAPRDAVLLAGRAALHARLGDTVEALADYREALRRDPDAPEAGVGFMHLVIESGHAPAPGDREFQSLAIRGLQAPWAKPAAVAPVLVALLRGDPAVARLLDPDAAPPVPVDEVLAGGMLDALAANPVLLALLEGALVPDAGFERFATALRARLLQEAGRAGAVPDDARLALHCALAIQCHLNDHVYASAPSDDEAARDLAARLQAALAADAPPSVPARWLPAVAAHLALASLPGAERLLALTWPAPVERLLDRTVREPLDERRRRGTLPRLTPIGDGVSALVRAQYEEDPYPKWPAMARPARQVDLAEFVRNRVPGSAYQPRHAPGRVEVLNAGCGTGQQPVDTALRLAGCRILAVDLSLSSLAYGARMAQRMGVTAIRFAQADLLALGTLDQRFDLIESTGVLHHLEDPGAGLRVLAGLLAPGGAMRLALYSEAARRGVVAARALIAAHGLRAVPGDIRRARALIAALPADAQARQVMRFADFHSLSECRDLLFHVQEHRFDLPGVRALVAGAGLRWLGLELTPAQHAAFARAHPDPAALQDTAAWVAFEAAHPDAFAGMYQFWVVRAD